MAVLAGLACSTSRPAVRQMARPAESSEQRPGTTVYACADDLRFGTRPLGDSLVLTRPERSDTLARVEAAAGAKYGGPGIVFWSRGEDVTLELDGVRHAGCRGRRAGDPWEEAALMGVDFRAIGQEPGWALDLVEGGWVRYLGDYGATRVYASSIRQARVAEPGTTVYEPEGRHLRLELREQPCSDAMSGESFTHAVTVRLNGRAVEGCGRMTRPGEVTNKYWKLTELDGKPAVVGSAREPHLRFQAADAHVAGSTGCNSLSGTFERHGDQLTLSRLVTTRMACTDSTLGSQEALLMGLLLGVDRAMAVGDRLTLYAHDRPVARFTAVHFQ
jgi:heat shock protein HslJ/membrane-bound inhibitor of C-type lysozyme